MLQEATAQCWFCWNSCPVLFPTDFVCFCLNYMPGGVEQLVCCKLCKQYCYPLLAGNFFSLLLFYFIFFSPWFLTTCHLEFPLWSCHQCQRDCFIIAYCINTAQSNMNPLLVSKITKQGQTGSFFFILSCGTGTSLQCRDSVTCKRGDVVKLQQNFWTQLVLCENLRGSWRHPS